MKITLNIAEPEDWILAGRAAMVTYWRWEKLGSKPEAEFLNEVEFENDRVFNCRRYADGHIEVERVV